MKRAVLLLLALTASLTAATGGSAQQPGGGLLVTRVCGANGCQRIFNGLFLIRPGSSPTPERATPPAFGEYFVLEPSNFRSEEQTSEVFGPVTPAFYVPDGPTLRARADKLQLAPQAWLQIPPAAESQLREALRGLDPFPAPHLTEVVIAGRRASDPEDYRALFNAFPPVREPSPFGRGRALAVVLRSDRPSPWTDRHNRLAYYPDLRLLYRDGEWVRPSAELIDRIEHPSAPGGGLPRWRVGGLVAPVLVLAAILALWLVTGKPRPGRLDARSL